MSPQIWWYAQRQKSRARRAAYRCWINLPDRQGLNAEPYFSEELSELNIVFRLLPSPLTTE